MATADSIPLLLSGTVSLILFLFLILKKTDLRSKLFGFFCFGLAIHGFSGFFTSYTTNIVVASFLNKFPLLGGIIAIPFFVHFSDAYEKKANLSTFTKIAYLLSLFFVIIGFGNSLVSETIPKPGGFTAVMGPAFPFIVLFTIVAYAHVLIRFIQLLNTEQNHEERNRVKYLLVFLTILAFAAILDMLRKLRIFAIADIMLMEYAILIFVIGIAYAIMKYKLLHINIVFHKSSMYSIIGAVLLILFEVLKDFIGDIMHFMLWSDNVAATRISLLIVTFMFEPIKSKTEKVCDKIFLGKKN